jgi:hypothetical protein
VNRLSGFVGDDYVEQNNTSDCFDGGSGIAGSRRLGKSASRQKQADDEC